MEQNKKIGGELLQKLKKATDSVTPKRIYSSIKDMQNNSRVKDIDEKRSKLDLMNKVLDDKQFENEIKIRETKLLALKQVYELLYSIGVNPADINSITQFRQKLEQQDPDLAELFFKSFEELISGLGIEDMEGSEPQMKMQDNQEINVPQNMVETQSIADQQPSSPPMSSPVA